jgi:hypothetical protein
VSQPIPTMFYLAVFREDQSGPQHKLFTSASGLLRFAEEMDAVKVRCEYPMDYGPFDVYAINTESLEVALYDIEPLRAAARGPFFKQTVHAARVAAGGRRRQRHDPA